MKQRSKSGNTEKSRKHWVPVRETPYYVADAAAAPAKVRVTMYLDSDVLQHFKRRAASVADGYQTLINRALRRAVEVESSLRNTAALTDALEAIQLTTSQARDAVLELKKKSA